MIEVNEESLKRFVNNIRDNAEKEQKEISDLLNDPLYMERLINKIKTDSYVFEYDKGDNKLSILYKIVENFARDSELVSILKHDYKYFYVEYKDCLFAIYRKLNDKGIMYGCFPVYINKKDLPYYIKYDDIRNAKAANINDLSTGLIADLRDIINKMIDEGFTKGFIEQLVGNIMNNKDNSDEKTNKLSK